jgi:uncharacterized protein (DUF58 family)
VRPALASFLLALVFGLTAALFDAEPLWVPAVVLAVLAAGSAAWVLRRSRGVTVRRRLGARRVIEDQPLSVVIEVVAGRASLPPATIIDPLLPGPVPTGGGVRLRRVRIDARFSHRGRRRLAPPRVRIADPLGLATREIAAAPSPKDDEVLVLPRIEPVTATTEGGAGLRMARLGHAALGAEVELDGIRPLREGTSAARIYWPSIARGGEPHERRLTAESDSRPLIVLDPRGAASDEQLDAAVRATASLAHRLGSAGGCALLLPGDRRPTELSETLAGWAHVHARLALLGAAAGPALGAVSGRRGPLIFVSARVRAALPASFGSSAGASRVLVVPGALPARRAAFTVAGCNGYVLGTARTHATSGAQAVGGGQG